MLMNNEIVKESNFATNTTNGRSPEALKELLCCGFKEEPLFLFPADEYKPHGDDVLVQVVHDQANWAGELSSSGRRKSDNSLNILFGK